MKNFQQKQVEDTPIRQEVQSPSVTDYMVKKLITFHPDTDIETVVRTLISNRITGAPVLNEKNELVGLIDDKDCLKVLFDSEYHNQPVAMHTVSNYMTSVMKTISPTANIHEVALIFLNTKYKRLVVVDDQGKLMGQISRHDILRAINDFTHDKWK